MPNKLDRRRALTMRMSRISCGIILAVTGMRLAVVCCLSLSLVGCQSPPTWSTAAWSPDRAYIARATIREGGGFGTDFVQTIVDLRYGGDMRHPSDVLAFSDGPAGVDGMKVGLAWLGPRHLEITYSGKRHYDYVNDHFRDVIITERDLTAASVSLDTGKR